MDENKIIQERTEKILKNIVNNPKWIFYILLILILILGIYIRMLPLADHNGTPGLWDATTQDYTLGPDLDPFLFLRYARTIIETGRLPDNDEMRYVPLGFDTSTELQMVSYMIVLTYKILNIFGEYSINYAGALMPVWFFALTILAFFFFVREIFLRKDKTDYIKANIIALISSLFMVIIPEFLSRTVAGIPEKESVAFFFMFLSLFLFLKSWKSDSYIASTILGVLAGISTALMGLSWGGVIYLYITIGLAAFISFLLGKVSLRARIAFGCWFLASLIIQLVFSNRFSIGGFVTSVNTGLATFVFFLFIFDLIIWQTKLNKLFKLERIKLPNPIISIILGLIVGVILVSIFIGPNFIFEKISGLARTLIKPIQGRWSTTVAENKQPYFSEWLGSFGVSIFWLFLAGSILLFKKMLSKLEKREALILTLFWTLFLFGLIFSRYASHPAILDGEGFISKFFYFGSALLLAGTFIYFYVKNHKENKPSFEHVEFEYIFLFSLFVLCLFTARSAVRLIMVLVPIAPIFLAYLLTEVGFSIKDKKENTKFIFMGLFLIILALATWQGIIYYKEITIRAYNYTPYFYTNQWQNAMSWVRENTPINSVFAHWWDYGYWVQSIGERATVTDGGNALVWWNYLTGRYVLTGDNEKQSLEFLYNHNATHLLIDSSDMVKYGAFSQIGSDKDYDRFSFGPVTLVSNQRTIKETPTGMIRYYETRSCLDEDINYNLNGTKIFLPGVSVKNNEAFCNTVFEGITLEMIQKNTTISFKQPESYFTYNNKQYKIPIRYVFYEGQIYDFKTGLNATLSLIPLVSSQSIDKMGSAIYISPRIMKTFLGQVYLLNDPFNNFPAFELDHSEQSLIIKNIESQGYNLGEFAFIEGFNIQGPIKIWKVNYYGDEKYNEEFLLKSPPDSIDWEF